MRKIHARHAFGVLGLFVSLAWSSGALWASGPPSPRISRITIRNTDIFDFETKPYLKTFPYTWINALHITTRKWIIRQEILLGIGDEVDPFLIRESERNLRALSFIRAARITQFPQRDGTVALVAYVNDSWTTEPQVNLGGVNAIDEFEAGFKEKNLFGWGKTAEFFYNSQIDSIQREFKYFDPRLFRSRWQLTGSTTNKSNGNKNEVILNRPFFSADTKWAGSITYIKDDEEIKDVVNNTTISRFDQVSETAEVSGALKIAGKHLLTQRLGLRFKKETTGFQRTSKTLAHRQLPESQEFQTLFVDYGFERNKFVETTRLEKMTRTEDLNLGPSLSLSPGFSPRALTGTKNTTVLNASYDQKGVVGRNHLMEGKATLSGRNPFYDSQNFTTTLMGKFYYRGFENQTWVIHSRAEWGQKLDADNQIKLGGDNGLRAFKTDEFTGNKSWVLNVEDRIFIINELWSLFSVGSVVFYDVGYAWPQGQPAALSKAKSDIGAGLRFGLTRSSNELVIRVDFSYRLARENRNDPDFVITFGSGQAF